MVVQILGPFTYSRSRRQVGTGRKPGMNARRMLGNGNIVTYQIHHNLLVLENNVNFIRSKQPDITNRRME